MHHFNQEINCILTYFSLGLKLVYFVSHCADFPGLILLISSPHNSCFSLSFHPFLQSHLQKSNRIIIIINSERKLCVGSVQG